MTEPKLAVYRAIAAVMAELGKQGIAKSRQATGSGANFKFRGIDQVYEALNPLLAQHNLLILPRVVNRSIAERTSSKGNPLFYTVLTVEFDFVSAEDGSMHTIVTIGEAMDSGDKSSSKCVSIAYKYACFIAFCIPVDADMTEDPDAEVHTVQAKGNAGGAGGAGATTIKPAVISEDEANTNYRDAVNRAEKCTTIAGVKAVWETEIKWDRIPTPWHDRLKKELRDIMAEIKKAAPKPAPAVAPKFDEDDSLPFPPENERL